MADRSLQLAGRWRVGSGAAAASSIQTSVLAARSLKARSDAPKHPGCKAGASGAAGSATVLQRALLLVNVGDVRLGRLLYDHGHAVRVLLADARGLRGALLCGAGRKGGGGGGHSGASAPRQGFERANARAPAAARRCPCSAGAAGRRLAGVSRIPTAPGRAQGSRWAASRESRLGPRPRQGPG